MRLHVNAVPVVYPRHVHQVVLSYYGYTGYWFYKGKVNIQHTLHILFQINVIGITTKRKPKIQLDFSEQVNTIAL